MGLIVHGSYINGSSKKNSCLGQMGHLGLRMPHLVSQFWISCKDYFRGQERHGDMGRHVTQ